MVQSIGHMQSIGHVQSIGHMQKFDDENTGTPSVLNVKEMLSGFCRKVCTSVC